MAALASLAAVAIACLAFAPGANAAKRQLSVIEDPARVLSADPIALERALDEIRDLDADILKIPVLWRSVAPHPTSRKKPKLDLSDPDSYGAGAWAVIDRAILGAALRGQKVWLMLTAPAPRWAVRREDAEAPGAYQPSPRDYGDFVEAAGRHFANVDYWSLLNEPNLSLFLRPQFKGGVAVSAIHYRKLYRAGEAALRSTGHGDDEILFGELLPRAPKPRRANGTVPPLLWLRDFFCLDADLRPLTGREARKRECSGFKPIRSTGFAYHPYTTPRGPSIRDAKPDTATIQHIGRVYAVLDAAHRHRRVTQRRMKVYSSEFGFQSNPPDRKGVPLKRIGEFLNVSEYLSYHDSRIATYSQYLVVDDVNVSSFQSGLRFSDGREKRGVYDAYRMPFVVTRRNVGSVSVWGKVRSGSGVVRTVTIEADSGDGFESAGKLRVNRRTGYFSGIVRLDAASSARFRSTAAGFTSRTAKAIPAPAFMP